MKERQHSKKYLDELKEAFEVWEKNHQAEFSKERKSEFATEDGIPVKRTYTPIDLQEKGFEYTKDIGFPGEFPYTRGITSTMGRTMPMIVSQYAGFGSPEESNKLWKTMAAAGTPSILMAYDLPSQLGLDPDHPKAEGEVGRVGCSISSQKDWEIAWDGIDLRKLMVNEVYNAPAIFAVANHLILAEKQGIPSVEVRGAIQNDTLKEFYSRGNYIFSPTQSMRLVSDTLSYCAEHAPNYIALQVCSVHQSEMGANAVHEMAFALADGFAYLQAAVDRGIEVDLIAPGIMMITAFRTVDFFEQIAKHRATRKIWAKVMKERFKAKKPESLGLRFYAPAGGTNFTKEEYLNNIARGAIGSLGAVLSGAQFFFMTGYDEQYGIPTKEAILNATQTARVATYETGCSDVVDPMAGSYYMEHLTLDMEERIWKELEEIDKRGGVIKCIESGYLHRAIIQDGYKWLKKFETGDIIRIGVNNFKTNLVADRPLNVFRTNPGEEQRRRTAIAELRKKRDNVKVKKALDEIKAVARLEATAQNNLMLPVIEAAKCYATVGEVCDALREVWGEYREPAII